MLNEVNRFFVLLSDATKYDAHGTITLAELVKGKLKPELTAAISEHSDAASWGFVPPPAGAMLDFISSYVLPPCQREAFDAATQRVGELFSHVASSEIREVFLTCLLLDNPDALKELSNHLGSLPTDAAVNFIYSRGSFDAMYAYIESLSDMPFGWWLSLNPLEETAS